MKAKELLEQLRLAPLTEPRGGMLEAYHENFAMTQEAEHIFVRFLRSPILDTRDAALFGLIFNGHRIGYEADALLLHNAGRWEDDVTQYAGIGYLAEMARNGSAVAVRILVLLALDPEWVREFGELVFNVADARATNWSPKMPDAREKLIDYIKSLPGARGMK